MDWNQVYAISGTIAAVGISVGGLLMWYLSKLDSDIKNISTSMNGWVQHLTAMQAEQSKRTDSLYGEILVIQKEIKQLYMERK